MPPTVVLISGANRGIGKGLLAIYLAKPDHTVIAFNRNPEHATSKASEDLPTGAGSKLIVVKADATVETDAAEAVAQLTAQGIDHIDTVIANAGIAAVFPKVSEVRIADIRTHMEINVFGVVSLYQATLSLLRKSERPKWITIGSSAGWIESAGLQTANTSFIRNQLPVPNAAYAPSKIAVHWLTKKINAEEDKVAAFVIHPGWAQTDTGNYSAKVFGFEEAPVTVDDSCTGIATVIEVSTKEIHGGKMWGHEGELMVW